MTIWNLGSINADHVYRVPHIPAPGETISSTKRTTGLGGKGTNMSVAAAQARAHVCHIGTIGEDGAWTTERLNRFNVDTAHIQTIGAPTGHAIIAVSADAENSIIVHPGANRRQDVRHLKQSLTSAKPGDTFLCQNETNLQLEAMQIAQQLGLKLAYAAAPFDVTITSRLAPMLDFVFMNEVEAAQFEEERHIAVATCGAKNVIITRGAKEAIWYGPDHKGAKRFAAHKVQAVDTTGAGDTFTGYTLAGLDCGLSMDEAIENAMIAAAIQVTRTGAADAIPTLSEVETLKEGL